MRQNRTQTIPAPHLGQDCRSRLRALTAEAIPQIARFNKSRTGLRFSYFQRRWILLGFDSEAAVSQKRVKTKKLKSKTKPTKLPAFARGQKWQMERGHAEIVQVGKTLVHYKFLKTGMVRGPLEMKSIPNFAEAMAANNARLVE
jgi:hypothetical protein